jgi:hypothetical protein
LLSLFYTSRNKPLEGTTSFPAITSILLEWIDKSLSSDIHVRASGLPYIYEIEREILNYAQHYRDIFEPRTTTRVEDWGTRFLSVPMRLAEHERATSAAHPYAVTGILHTRNLYIKLGSCNAEYMDSINRSKK